MTEITLLTTIEAPIQIVFDCARSIDVHLASTAATNEKVVAGKDSGLCELGDEITWGAKHFGIYQTLSSKITKMKAPFYFQDKMLKGAFLSLKHDHFFEENENFTVMKDIFFYETPFGLFGQIFNRLILKRYLTNFLKKRNEVIREFAENTHYLAQEQAMKHS